MSNSAIGRIRSHRSARTAAAVLAAAALGVAAPALGGDQTRGMHGSCTTTFAFNETGAVDLAGTCNYSHLGFTTVVATQIVTALSETSVAIVNTAVYTAANGDKLSATFEGTGQFTSLTTVAFSGTETYHGGTGRFLDATGSASLSGDAVFSAPGSGAGKGHYTLSGRIAY